LAKLKRLLQILSRYPLARETAIFLGFCAFTAAVTWPYVTRLRDAVVDAGDPYLVSWMLWWDYHQTFTDPLNLFQSNLFFPYHYTLAFSEHCYGIALPFFPLFALGFRPLTVHAVAIFFGFATCGYGAFRLARTTTGSDSVAWLAGIIFAFGPFRYHYLSHLPYLFAMWIPLSFEALVLFVRDRTWRRTVWLGFAIFMLGLSTISWLIYSALPLILVGAVLLTRYNLWRDRQLWYRGFVGLFVAGLALLPFMLPYYKVSKLYGFQRNIDEIKQHSAWPRYWLSAEVRNRFWRGMGAGVEEGWRHKLFPGLLPILLSIVALVPEGVAGSSDKQVEVRNRKLLGFLDVAIVICFCLALIATGFDRTEYYFGIFGYLTSDRVLLTLTILVMLRLCIAYPRVLGLHGNFIETLRDPRRSDAFWIGTILFVVGFLYSMGWNFFFYRMLYELFLPFRSVRVPTRGAMVAYVGMSLLAGLGAKRLSEYVAQRWQSIRRPVFFTVVCALLIVEFNVAPLRFMRGEVFPDAVTLRLKQTAMRGGIVVLPAGEDFNYRSMLRAADHAKPLIVGTSGFNPPYEDQIERMSHEHPISDKLLDLFEQIPASYLVVNTNRIKPEQRDDFRDWMNQAVASGRLRFINRFDGRDDLFAITKTEPEAVSESQFPPTSESPLLSGAQPSK
jgi:hypothetical protein